MQEMQKVIKQLVETGKWSANHATVAFNANFKCEYCGLDLLQDAHHYKLWQMDHIVPKYLMLQEGGDPEDFDNLAIACKPCNFDFKWNFDPRTTAGPNPTRIELINAAKQQIQKKRRDCEIELSKVREVIGTLDK
jgi:5-methylcytosine-specific restriction endonuclease McrA